MNKYCFDIGANSYYEGKQHSFKLYFGDSLEILTKFPPESVDMIFADPPYFLSNGGITCHAGKMVPVNKGDWDTSNGLEKDHQFTLKWLGEARRLLKNDGSLWVSGTMHNIYSIGFAMQKLGFKLLNEVCWFKPNASPNLSCRYFTHSHETLIWGAKSIKSKHMFNYQAMKEMAGGKQMRSLWMDLSISEPGDIWPLSTPGLEEKKYGKHPTQKPLALLERIILAATQSGDLILDPFSGSSTTGIAAIRNGRSFIGIDNRQEFLDLSIKRFESECSNGQRLSLNLTSE